MDYPLARKDLSATCSAAEASCKIEGAAAISILYTLALSCIQSYADRDRVRRTCSSLATKPLLKINRGAKRLSSGCKHCKRLVTPQLDDASPMSRDTFPRDRGELRGQPRRRFVSMFLCKACIASDVRK
jgi:RNase P subunit RPR2